MRKMRVFRYLLVLMGALVFVGCAATARVIDYGPMKTDVAMSESIFLTPTEGPRTIFVEIRNTSSIQGVTADFQSRILSGFQDKGCQLMQKPSQATYILQANIKYIGELKEGMNFEGTMTGSGLGALAGLGIGGSHHWAGGAIAGGLIGAGIGLIADVATRVKSEILVIEFQITEKVSPEEDVQQVEKSETSSETKTIGGIGTIPNAPTTKVVDKKVTSKREGVNIYTAGIAARAMQVNMDVGEATRRLIDISAMQILGIF